MTTLDLKKGKKLYTGDARDFDAATIGLTLKEVVIPQGNLGNYELLFGETEKSEKMFYDFSFPLGMFGNDKYGDCVPAFYAGAEILDSLEGKRAAKKFDDKSVLQGYSEATGFEEGNPNTDQGTELRAYMLYHQSPGIPDENGKRDKMGAFAQLSRGVVEDALKSVVVCGKSPIGILVPNYLMNQFNAKEPFDVKKNATRQEAEIDGGHCIGVVGTFGEYLVVRTWGTLALMTYAAFEKFCDESWIYFTSEFLHDGKSIAGLDKEKSLQIVEHA